MNARAEVSIVIPIKGRASLFAETAESLVRQSLPDWEAIVIDDGSSPEEFSQIARIAGGDRRFHLRANPGRPGASACRNAGFAASTGAFVIFLDSDDLLAPPCLQRRIEAMAANPAIDFAVFPTLRFRRKAGDSDQLWYPVKAEDDLNRFLAGPSPWQTAGPIWRTASLARVGPWDERALSWQDWEFHVRALALGAKYIKLTEPDSFWRMSAAGSISHSAHSQRHIVNRVRIYGRIVSFLRTHGALSHHRRRILARHFFDYAFRTGQSQKRALQFWSFAWRSGVVNPLEFALLRAAEPLIRNKEPIGRRLQRILYPRDC